MLFADEDLPSRGCTGTQGRKAAMWDMAGMLWSQMEVVGVCESA